MRPTSWVTALLVAGCALAARMPDEHMERSRMVTTHAADRDRVHNLPGIGKPSSPLYAGYITVDESAGRALFYILAESASSVDDPVILWLNGGPGCSSIGGGFLSELGPYYPSKDGSSLKANQYAWNREAHVVFLESPAFVGFSYSNTSTDAVVGDARTASDSFTFLRAFFRRFPHLADNPFFIAGESYAGHYVPNLAALIVTHNQANEEASSGSKGSLSKASSINLQGLLVGNPWTDAAIDNEGAVDFWWAHAMVSDATAMGIKKACNFSAIGPLHPRRNQQEALCQALCDTAQQEFGPINIYNVYADVCVGAGRSSAAGAALAAALGDTPAGWRMSAGLRRGAAAGEALQSAQHAGSNEATAGSKAAASGGVSQRWLPDPCVDGEVEEYLNLGEVQRSLHANQTVKLPWRWTDCSSRVMYSQTDLMASMLPVYRKLLAAQAPQAPQAKQGSSGGSSRLRILIYSGDVDGIVPVVGTRRWVAGLGLDVKAAWRPWLSGGGGRQVGGHVIEYDGITLATVRQAGHMVPYTQPERAYHMMSSFVRGQPL